MASSVFFTHSHCYSSKPSSLVFRLHRQVGLGPTSLGFSSSHVAPVGIKFPPCLRFFVCANLLCGFQLLGLSGLLFNKKCVLLLVGLVKIEKSIIFFYILCELFLCGLGVLNRGVFVKILPFTAKTVLSRFSARLCSFKIGLPVHVFCWTCSHLITLIKFLVCACWYFFTG